MSVNYPKHIAFILDGNRRWAKTRGVLAHQGHKRGIEQVECIKNWIKQFNLNEVTLYCFSMQNFNRSKSEVKILMNYFITSFEDLLTQSKQADFNFRIRHIGRLTMLPEKLQKLIEATIMETEDNSGPIINFAIAYGGQEEIIDSIKRIATKGSEWLKDLTVEKFKKQLQLKNYPDIIIRTGGEYRTSNFLVWQQAYAEWFFVEKMWPDFETEDLKLIIDSYLNRERRFGK